MVPIYWFWQIIAEVINLFEHFAIPYKAQVVLLPNFLQLAKKKTTGEMPIFCFFREINGMEWLVFTKKNFGMSVSAKNSVKSTNKTDKLVSRNIFKERVSHYTLHNVKILAKISWKQRFY